MHERKQTGVLKKICTCARNDILYLCSVQEVKANDNKPHFIKMRPVDAEVWTTDLHLHANMCRCTPFVAYINARLVVR